MMRKLRRLSYSNFSRDMHFRTPRKRTRKEIKPSWVKSTYDSDLLVAWIIRFIVAILILACAWLESQYSLFSAASLRWPTHSFRNVSGNYGFGMNYPFIGGAHEKSDRSLREPMQRLQTAQS